jgi:phage terminase large subunit
MTQIVLDKFQPRFYQSPIIDAIENRGYKRVLAILPRRAGKDLTAFNLCIRECIRKPCVIYYIFPTYSQAKKVIWDSVTNTGDRILDYVPAALVDSMNSQEMKIRFKNGSLLQLVGSDNYDSLMGTNPQGVVFSEYALQDPRAYQYIRPILTANQGWALFISTPRGKNHLWELYQIAITNPAWFTLKLTVDDTKHIPLSEIDKERTEGIMSEDLIQQEYFTSFTMGVEGAYYAHYIDKMRLEGRIGRVPWNSGYKVHTACDLGSNKTKDSFAMIFFQVIGQAINIIDFWDTSKAGFEMIAKYMFSKPYQYGKHFAPVDVEASEVGTGMSRIEKAKELGINYIKLKKELKLANGIEAVRTTLSRTWIDDTYCAKLIKALENYREDFDPKTQSYKGSPRKDWTEHPADAMRYLCNSLYFIKDGLTPEKLEKMYQEAVYGTNSNMPSVFRDDLPPY